MSPRLRASGAVCFLCLAATPAHPQTPAGPEFRVSSYTTESQIEAHAAMDRNGNFVVVWQSAGQDLDSNGIYAQRFTGAGVPRGSEFRVNVHTTGSQRDPSVASSPTGEFVVVWETPDQDGDSWGIFARRYNAQGSPLGPAFKVNTYTTGDQTQAHVAIADNGNFVVVWRGEGTHDDDGVSARRFNAAGLPLSNDFVLNMYTLGTQSPGAIAMDAGGNFVVVWTSEGGQDGDDDGVFLRRFGPGGAPLAAEFQVNTYTTGDQDEPALAVAPNGDFAVVWESFARDGSNDAIVGRAFAASGTPLTGEFQVNAYTTGGQHLPSVAMGLAGELIATWESPHDGSLSGSYARAFNLNGLPLTAEFRVNTYTLLPQRRPSVASNRDGDFVVAWESEDQDGDEDGIYAQRYGDLIFQDDFESGSLSLWSAYSTDGSDLSASAAAALAGTNTGLEAFVDDTTGIYVLDETPAAESRYRMRFYLDPNNFDPGEADGKRRVRVFIAFNSLQQRVVTLVLRRVNGNYSLQARTRRDDGTRAEIPFVDIGNAPYRVELDWLRASGPGANNGALTLWINGLSAGAVTGLDNDLSTIESARLGVMTIKTAAASGAVLFDQFESRRIRYIGPE